MTPPIGIYVRVSAKGDRQDDRFHSPSEQAERARGVVVARGYEPGPVFEDIDVSGATPPGDRPAMGELLGAIESGALGGAAAFSLDRFSREPAHGDALVKRVTRAGGVLLAPDVPDDIDSPTGEFTFGMLLQVAKLYRAQAGARYAAAKARAIVAGIPVGPTPLGYRRREDRRLEVDPQGASIVRELFERRARGDGTYVLTDLIIERTGRRWSRSGVVQLLRNRIYATGRLEYGDVVSEWDAGAIVDEPLWHAAQVTGPRPRMKRTPDSSWLLTGLLRCASCGYNLRPHRAGPDPEHRYRRYQCRNRTCTAKASVAARRIEAWVLARSLALGDEMSTRAEAPDLAALEDAVAVAERRVEQVLAPEARDALGELWAADVKARREELARERTALGEAQVEAGIPSHDFRLRDVWEGLSNEDRRAALALYWRDIFVGRPGPTGLPLRLVARGPAGEAEVALPALPSAEGTTGA